MSARSKPRELGPDVLGAPNRSWIFRRVSAQAQASFPVSVSVSASTSVSVPVPVPVSESVST